MARVEFGRRRAVRLAEATLRSQHTLPIVPALILAAVAALPAAATAQGTSADYARAEGLRARYENAVVDIAGPATAIGRSHRFWVVRRLS